MAPPDPENPENVTPADTTAQADTTKPEKEPKTRIAWLDTELHKL